MTSFSSLDFLSLSLCSLAFLSRSLFLSLSLFSLEDVPSLDVPAALLGVETAVGPLLGSLDTANDWDWERRRKVSWAGVWTGVDLFLCLRSS